MKKRLLAALLLAVLMLFSACKQESAPEDVLKLYYDSLEKGDYKQAYSCLSKDIKSDIKFEDYEEYFKLTKEKADFVGYAPGTKHTTKDVKKGGKVKYKEAVVIPVDEKTKEKSEGAQIKTTSVERLLALEDGSYKLIWEVDVNRLLSQHYVGLAEELMKGQKPEYDKALENIETAIQKDDQNPMAYYFRGAIMSQKDKVEEAIADINRCIELQEGELKLAEKAEPSQAVEAKKQQLKMMLAYSYNAKGMTLAKNKQLGEATECLKKALEYDPSNEFAKMSLERIGGKAK